MRDRLSRDEYNDLRTRISEAQTKDTPRYRRAFRTTTALMQLMRDFIPHDSECMRRVEEHLMEGAFFGNVELINVPDECDALDKLQLEARRLEMSSKPLIGGVP